VVDSASEASTTPLAAQETPDVIMESSERFDPAYPRTLSPMEHGLPRVVRIVESEAAPEDTLFDEEMYVVDARPSSWPPAERTRKRSISEVTDAEEPSARRKSYQPRSHTCIATANEAIRKLPVIGNIRVPDIARSSLAEAHIVGMRMALEPTREDWYWNC
jgi:hypothetical protein